MGYIYADVDDIRIGGGWSSQSRLPLPLRSLQLLYINQTLLQLALYALSWEKLEGGSEHSVKYLMPQKKYNLRFLRIVII